MINDIKKDAEARMQKSVEALKEELKGCARAARIRGCWSM